MCYEGKLVAAVLASRGIVLDYEITGGGQSASIIVSGRRHGSQKIDNIKGSVKDWRTTGAGSPWDKQPEQQLIYRGTRQWARTYAPEALLGVHTPDEALEIRDVEAVVHGVDAEPVPAKARTVEAATEPEQQPEPETQREAAKRIGLEVWSLGRAGQNSVRAILAGYGVQDAHDIPEADLTAYAQSLRDALAELGSKSNGGDA